MAPSALLPCEREREKKGNRNRWRGRWKVLATISNPQQTTAYCHSINWPLLFTVRYIRNETLQFEWSEKKERRNRQFPPLNRSSVTMLPPKREKSLSNRSDANAYAAIFMRMEIMSRLETNRRSSRYRAGTLSIAEMTDSEEEKKIVPEKRSTARIIIIIKSKRLRVRYASGFGYSM